jgi:hypothetical protein
MIAPYYIPHRGITCGEYSKRLVFCQIVEGANHTMPQEITMAHDEQIVRLEKGIADLKARLPKHSVPAAMIIELEELEEELEKLKAADEQRTLGF